MDSQLDEPAGVQRALSVPPCKCVQWILTVFPALLHNRSFKAIDTLLEDNAAELPPSRYTPPAQKSEAIRSSHPDPN